LQDINEFLLKYHLLHKFAFIGFFRFFEEVRIGLAVARGFGGLDKHLLLNIHI
jgi:hypothetical protein